MELFTDTALLRNHLEQQRHAGQCIGLVPTMGNLHEGHLSLVRAARADCDQVVATIFVNPLQFGAGEDLDSYPRTPEEDRRQLAEAGCDLLFMPSVETMYPAELEEQTRVSVPGVSEGHCGASRPGHFDGVATVVCKLFNLVRPDIAYFGEKDFQQLLVIRKMAADLCFGIDIQGVPIRREAGGLAMSSRNRYLGAEQKKQAPALYRCLQMLAQRIRTGERDYRALEYEGRRELVQAGFNPDYLHICRQDDLQPANTGDNRLVILAAAWLGQARLIDNQTIELDTLTDARSRDS